MRIKQLDIQAFGPFGGFESIDFKQINKKQLFLITGNTGAGKTTIFDSVCFALYGKTSGSQRNEPENLRSHFAIEELDTYVRLIFEVNKETYEIKRYPKQQRYSKRTKGYVSKNQTIEFKSLNQPTGILTKIQEVDQKILEVIGLTYEQFRQIVMLPQGEFQKLLTSKSDDKTEIFRKIFQTESFEEFQNRLFEKRNNAFKQIEKDINQLELIKKQLSSSSEPLSLLLDNEAVSYEDMIKELDSYLQKQQVALQIKKDALKEEEVLLNQARQSYQYNEQQNKYLDEQATLKQQKHSLESQSQFIESLKIELDQYEQTRAHVITYQDYVNSNEEINRLNIMVEALHKQLSEAKQAFLQAEEAQKAVTTLEKERDNQRNIESDLKRELQKLKDLKNDEAEFTRFNDELEQLEKQSLELNKDVALKKKSQQALEETIKTSELKIKQIGPLYQTIETETNEQKKLEELSQIYDTYIKEKESYSQLLSKLDIEDKTFKETRTIYETTKQAYHHSLVDVLRKELVDNEPCPVCGSTNHPQKALTKERSFPTKEEVMKAESIYLESLKQKERLETSLNEKRDVILALELKLPNEKESISNDLEIKKAHVNKIKQEITNLEHLRETIENQNRAVKSLLNQIESINHSVHQNELLKAKSQEKIRKQNELILKYQNELKNKDDQMVVLELNTIDEQIKQIEQTIKTLNEDHRKKELIYKEVELNLSNTKKRAEEQQTKNKQSKRVLDSFLERKQMSLETFKQILSTKDIKEKQQKVNEYTKKEIELQTSLNKLMSLITIDQKVDLETLKESLFSLEQSFKHNQVAIQNEGFYLEETAKRVVEFKTTYDSYIAYGKTFERIKRLSDLSRGLTYNKVSFERYVLSYFFDQILRKANLKLAFMTSNRYYLKRKEDKSRGNQTSGLDLQIYDRNTTRVRDVETLSGGETFKASLCLALGLAEVIKETSGGIEMDTMFIDEGFGTLDQESLDQAIDVLMNLNEEGRIVGLISHVGDLKSVIETQIEIEVSKTGSTIRKED
ncbi:DNA repair exonuclease, subunit C [Paracholeplasma brassicae]|uniref:Nuclease SbcCD subunit C n=1 Tax=Acholeplasma brassicae TaxID=61635 RepID=U4KSI5_9MOLU|nr:SMC family ATPase [Paracholeplasma brassicae]CCV65044.1 DNA repair exonuclease, subunit C [Paracholeplasma brassicae]